jgi:hypothetical protein
VLVADGAIPSRQVAEEAGIALAVLDDDLGARRRGPRADVARQCVLVLHTSDHHRHAEDRAGADLGDPAPRRAYERSLGLAGGELYCGAGVPPHRRHRRSLVALACGGRAPAAAFTGDTWLAAADLRPSCAFARPDHDRPAVGRARSARSRSERCTYGPRRSTR